MEQQALQPGAHSWEKRMECVGRYMLLGNLRVVSEQCNVSYKTLQDWKQMPWWKELVEQIRQQKKQKTSDTLTKVVEQSLDILQERLENGDWVYNQKTGAIIRKPVSARDATNITTNLLQRQLQLEDLSRRHEIQADSVQETLAMLAREFKKWNKSGRDQLAEDIPFVEVIEEKQCHS